MAELAGREAGQEVLCSPGNSATVVQSLGFRLVALRPILFEWFAFIRLDYAEAMQIPISYSPKAIILKSFFGSFGTSLTVLSTFRSES
jgi:hypothetical protein